LKDWRFGELGVFLGVESAEVGVFGDVDEVLAILRRIS